MLSFHHLIMSNGKPYSIWRHDRSVINNSTISATFSMSTGGWIQLIAQQYLTITWNYASGTGFNQALHKLSQSLSM